MNQADLILHTVACGLIIFGMLLISARFFNPVHVGGPRKHCKFAMRGAWLCFMAGLILDIIAEYTSLKAYFILHSIAYPLLILGMLFTAPRFFSSGRFAVVVSWFFIVAGLIVEIVSVHI